MIVAADDGTWKVELDPMPASKEGRPLTVSGAKPDAAHWLNGFGLWAAKNATNEQKIEDVLVGEVWFCAGQSNTSCPIWGSSPRFRDGQGAMALQMTKRPLVRLVKTPRGYRAEMFVPAAQLTGWEKMKPGATIGLSFTLVVEDLKNSQHELYWPNSKRDNLMKKPWTWAKVKLEK